MTGKKKKKGQKLKQKRKEKRKEENAVTSEAQNVFAFFKKGSFMDNKNDVFCFF